MARLYLYYVSKAPDSKTLSKSHRSVAQERFPLQGFDVDTLMGSSDAVKVQASGNAYPVPLMLAVLAPILSTVKKDLHKKVQMKPVTCTEATHVCKLFDDFMNECKQQLGTAVGKKARAMKAMKAMKTMKAMKACKKPAAAHLKATAKAKGNKTKKTMTKKTNIPMKKSVKGKRHVDKAYRWISSSSS